MELNYTILVLHNYINQLNNMHSELFLTARVLSNLKSKTIKIYK